jgi:hypothetical protein
MVRLVSEDKIGAILGNPRGAGVMAVSVGLRRRICPAPNQCTDDENCPLVCKSFGQTDAECRRAFADAEGG